MRFARVTRPLIAPAYAYSPRRALSATEAPTADAADAPVDDRSKSTGRPPNEPTYSWPALWIFPSAIILLFVLLRGGCRYTRRCASRARGRAVEDGDTSTTDDEEASIERGASTRFSVSDDEVREYVRALRDAEGEERSSARTTASERARAARDAPPEFDPGLWRQLAISRELERRQHASMTATRPDEDSSTHRPQVLGLPRRLDSPPPRAYEESTKAARGASRTALRSLPRCVVGSPRWFQFLRANGHLEGPSTSSGAGSSSDVDECAICVESFEEDELAVVLRCAHVFHESCAVPWLRMHASCPVCRLDVTRMSLTERHDVFTRRRDPRPGRNRNGARRAAAAA